MLHHRMPQDVLLAEHHGTFRDTPSNKMILLNLQNKLDIKEKGQRRWSHQFMFADKLVPHLSSQRALAHMAKTLSFHNVLSKIFISIVVSHLFQVLSINTSAWCLKIESSAIS